MYPPSMNIQRHPGVANAEKTAQIALPVSNRIFSILLNTQSGSIGILISKPCLCICKKIIGKPMDFELWHQKINSLLGGDHIFVTI